MQELLAPFNGCVQVWKNTKKDDDCIAKRMPLEDIKNKLGLASLN